MFPCIINSSIKTQFNHDDGATANFIDFMFTRKHNLPLQLLAKPRKLEMANGDAAPAVTHYVSIPGQIGGHKEILTCYVTRLSQYNVVLGSSWTDLHDPDLRQRRLAFTSDYCRKHCLSEDGPDVVDCLHRVEALEKAEKLRKATIASGLESDQDVELITEDEFDELAKQEGNDTFLFRMTTEGDAHVDTYDSMNPVEGLFGEHAPLVARSMTTKLNRRTRRLAAKAGINLADDLFIRALALTDEELEFFKEHPDLAQEAVRSLPGDSDPELSCPLSIRSAATKEDL